MKVDWTGKTSRPYIKKGTLYLPHTQIDIRWEKIVTEPVAVVVRLEWQNSGSLDSPGWVAEWVFFRGEQEIPWDEVRDKVSVAQSFREWNFHPDDVIPWGDDIETLVALEGM